MDIKTLGTKVKQRREALGLTLLRLAKLAALSDQVLQRLESGTFEDPGDPQILCVLSILGLSFDTISLDRRKKKRGIWMAAKTSSVSYAGELTEEMLVHSLATGEPPIGYEPHIRYLLNEVPISIIVMAVEEAAAHENCPPAQIWNNLSQLATTYGGSRRKVWE